MWATWGSSLTFHHLAAVISVNFNNLPVGTSELILSSSAQHLSGTFISGTLSETSLPGLAYSDGGSQSVRVTFPATTVAEDRTVFIPIPAGTYDLKLQARVGSDIRNIKTWTTREFARGKLYRAGVNYVEMSASSTSDISDGLSSIAAGEKVEINIAGNISTDDAATIAIPVVGGNASIGLTFAEPVVTPDGHPLVITDGSAAESSAAQNSLTITLPDATDVNMDLSLPTTTVALASSGTATVYKSISATTATNTLVIGHGVHIETLTINGGNVVMDGGRVDLLINNAEAGTTITATSSDQMIDKITSTHDLTLGSEETGSKLLTVGDMEVTAGAVTFIKCKATGIVTHTSSDMLKMTYSGSNYIERLNLDYGSAGVEVYGTVNKLYVYADGATVDCKYGSSGCGINFIQTMGQIKTLIWRTLDAGILSTVNYRVYIFRIETSSSNAQVFTLSDGGRVQVFELMKDINVFLTAEGRQSWGNPILAGDYDSIYYVQPEHSLPRWDTVVLTLDGEDGLYYGFADIKAAYEYAYWVKKNTVMNIKLNFDLYSKDYFTFGSGYDVTIDLNGRDLKFAGRYNFGTNAADQSKFYSNIYLFNGAKLTFTGTGKVTSDVETDALCYVETSSSANTTLTFNGDAEFVAPTRVVWTERGSHSGSLYDGIPTCVVNAGRFSQSSEGELFYIYSGELYVRGGEFNAGGNGFTLKCYDANCTSPDTNQNTGPARIAVTGGRFYLFDPANNLAVGAGTNYVLTGYTSSPDGEWFVVGVEE
jgi:NAD(P)-dependent dehydrogenase (short-subunit alcohol dehydrogenase family)